MTPGRRVSIECSGDVKAKVVPHVSAGPVSPTFPPAPRQARRIAGFPDRHDVANARTELLENAANAEEVAPRRAHRWRRTGGPGLTCLALGLAIESSPSPPNPSIAPSRPPASPR